jgi:hypothetical protein
MNSKLIRNRHLAPKIIVIDGLPGCGKTMLSPIISALDRVEVMTFSYELEYILTLSYLGKITDDAANTMIRISTDLKLYNLMMSRETNFRPSDLSSIFKHKSPIRYIKRLFEAGDESIPEKIISENPILLLTTHQMSALSKPLFNALRSRLFFIEIVRHPLYMIIQNTINMSNITSDVRDFDLQIDFHGRQLPFYSFGYEKEFDEALPVEKAILFMDKFTSLAETNMRELNLDKNPQFIKIPFEPFVLNPWPYLKTIEESLGSKITKKTKNTLKKQKVPREKISDGIPLDIYKRCGWEEPDHRLSEVDELDKRRQYVLNQGASDTALKVLDKLCVGYESNYYKVSED